MWMVVGVANNQAMASKMLKVLETEGILVKLSNASVRTNRPGNTYEIMVLESEADLSRDILLENGL